MSGIQEAIQKLGQARFYEWCERGYKYLRQLDDRYSEWFGVNRSIKITSVKPSGTVSLLPGVAPGIHYPCSKYYFRTVRLGSDSPYIRQLRKAGYRCVDLSPKEPNTTVVYFAQKYENFARSVDQVSIWEQAENIAKMQHYWADNQVSATITFSAEEADQIIHVIEAYAPRVKSLSFLPRETHGYEHAPQQPISKADYLSYISNLSEIDFTDIVDRDEEEKFCDSERCGV